VKKAVHFVIGFSICTIMLSVMHGAVDSAPQCDVNMAYIPAGTFFTGTTREEFNYLTRLCELTIGGCYPSWFENEMPRRRVENRAFCIDRFEYPNRPGGYPMAGANYKKAAQFCREEGKRLCTEVEWERACRAGKMERVWSFGYKYNPGACNINSEGIEPSGFNPDCRSREGIYDMNGNLSEWVLDSFSETIGGQPRIYHILKGGSYNDRPIFTRCSYVDVRQGDLSYSEFGFRCCSDTMYSRAPAGEMSPDIDIEPAGQ